MLEGRGRGVPETGGEACFYWAADIRTDRRGVVTDRGRVLLSRKAVGKPHDKQNWEDDLKSARFESRPVASRDCVKPRAILNF